MRELTDDTFDEYIASADTPVLVEFWASWCPPCKMMEPMMKKLAEAYEGSCEFVAVNIDRNARITERFEVTGVPTFIVLQDGEAIGSRLVGAQTKKKIKSMVDRATEAEDRGRPVQ